MITQAISSSFFKTPKLPRFSTLARPASEVKRLFDYTSNKFKVTSKIASITPTHEGLKELQRAIKYGDKGADIFTDPDCSIYLLKMMETGVIPFAEGITVYTYLMALMQYSDYQPIANSDEYLKCH